MCFRVAAQRRFAREWAARGDGPGAARAAPARRSVAVWPIAACAREPVLARVAMRSTDVPSGAARS
ncbi:hypothetical protein CNO08_25040 [Lysobacter capsici]|nr:hypothetical protein CNO08_25040 [Lysobacter capsici]